jgi:hypothetical protein
MIFQVINNSRFCCGAFFDGHGGIERPIGNDGVSMFAGLTNNGVQAGFKFPVR